MSENETFQYRPRQGKGLDQALVKEAMRLHEAGWSNVAIGKKLGRHNSNIQRLLKKMGSLSVNKDMKDSGSTKSQRSIRVIGHRAPESQGSSENFESSHSGSNESERLTERITRLEKELEDARLRADLYEEIINVAENKFDIQIRKKAGTKQ